MEFDDEGKVFGVTSEAETAKCKKVVCDPSYLPNKVPYNFVYRDSKVNLFSFYSSFYIPPRNLVKNVGESYIIIDMVALS